MQYCIVYTQYVHIHISILPPIQYHHIFLFERANLIYMSFYCIYLLVMHTQLRHAIHNTTQRFTLFRLIAVCSSRCHSQQHSSVLVLVQCNYLSKKRMANVPSLRPSSIRSTNSNIAALDWIFAYGKFVARKTQNKRFLVCEICFFPFFPHFPFPFFQRPI